MNKIAEMDGLMDITLYDIASRFIGLEEIPGPMNSAQIIAMLELDNTATRYANPAIIRDEIPWCSAFVNYCAWLLDLPRSKSLMARSWLTIGSEVSLSDARLGFDVCVFWSGEKDNGVTGHAGLFNGVLKPPDRVEYGIYVPSKPESMLILGGNQGNRVSVAKYPISRLLGIRRLRNE